MDLRGLALRRCTAIWNPKRVACGEMSRDTFMLLFVLGSGVLAFWVAMCRPRFAPGSFRSGTIHLAIVGAVLGPVVHAVPGLPSMLSVMVALFALALPAITYMLLVGLWLMQLAVRQTSSVGR
jgi:hypothetical protein